LPAPYPIELRQRVVDAYGNGEGTYLDMADRFLVGIASVSRWLSLTRNTGSAAAKPTGGNRRADLPANVQEAIKVLVLDEPNWTTEELAAQVQDEFGVKVDRQRVGRFLRRSGFTFKRGSSDPELPRRPRKSNNETPLFATNPGWKSRA
jgi:transposase